MGNVHMEASQINYRGGEEKMSVEQALKQTSGEAAAIAQLQVDVGDLQDTKANLITIAPVFSAETAYDPGDLVYYNGLTYRCVNAHEGEWDADDFSATTIGAELDSLRSGLNNVGTGDLLLAIAKSDTDWKNISNLFDYSYLYFVTSYYVNTPNPIYTSGILPLFIASAISEYYQMDSSIKINFIFGLKNLKVQDWGNTTANYLLVYGIK